MVKGDALQHDHATLTELPLTLERLNCALHGTLTLPKGGPAGMAVLLLAGSGPVDRDGNLPGMTNNSLRLLAHGLACHGIAVLRVDKRGIGASAVAGVTEEGLRFQTYVDDAVAWLEVLQRQRGFCRSGLVGHSEGALVATLASRRHSLDRLVLLAGAGHAAGRVIRRQLAEAGVSSSWQAQAGRILNELEAGRGVAKVPAELLTLFRPSVQPYLMSWLSLDPAAELARAPLDALVVQGNADFQVGAEDAQRLVQARPGNSLAIIDGMNHVLKDAPSERAANLATYSRPDLPLTAELVPLLAAYLLDK